MAIQEQSRKMDDVKDQTIDLTDYSQYSAENKKYSELHTVLQVFSTMLNHKQAIINLDDNKVSLLSAKNFEHDIEKLIYELETGSVKYASLTPVEQEAFGNVVLTGLNEAAVTQMQKDGIKPSVLTKVGEDRYQAIINVYTIEQNTTAELHTIENKLRARYTDGSKEEIAIPGIPFKNGVGEIVQPLPFLPTKSNRESLEVGYISLDLKEIIAQKDDIYKAQEQAVVKYATEKHVEKEQKNEVQDLIEKSPVLAKVFEKVMGKEKTEKIVEAVTVKKPITEQEKKAAKIEDKVALAVKDQGFSTKKEVEAEKKLSPAQKAAIVEEMQKNQQPKQENYLQEPAQQIARGEGNIFGAVLEGMKKLAEWLVNLMVVSLVKMRGLSIQAVQGNAPDMWQKKGTHSEQELTQDRDMSQHMQDKEAAQKMAAEMGVKVSEAKKVVQNQQETKKTVQFVQQEQGQDEEQGQSQGR